MLLSLSTADNAFFVNASSKEIVAYIAQQWITDSLSRSEENKLTFIEAYPFQQRLATVRSITRSNDSEKTGKLLPVSFHGSPAKRKVDTEDALANRKRKPHIMITMTCNPIWSEIVQNLLQGQQASDHPDLCYSFSKSSLLSSCLT